MNARPDPPPHAVPSHGAREVGTQLGERREQARQIRPAIPRVLGSVGASAARGARGARALARVLLTLGVRDGMLGEVDAEARWLRLPGGHVPWGTPTRHQRDRAFTLAVIAVIVAWVFFGPRMKTPAPGLEAQVTVIGMFLATIVAMRQTRPRFGLNSEGAMSLPNPLYALYVVTIFLVGGHEAVLVALLTPLAYSAVDLVWRRVTWDAVLRQCSVSGLGTLLCSVVYGETSRAVALRLTWLQAHLVAAALAAAMMLVAAAVLALWSYGPSWLVRGWRTDLASPSFRFQALMLSVCPLFPLAETLSGAEAALAWILLLVPLYALYYLALISMRLEQRSAELQRTVGQLRAVRRREAELTNYAALITHAQEEERRRLARDLHDDTAQALVALSRGIDALASRFAAEGSAGDRDFFDDLGSLAKHTLDGIRRACQDLRPSVLDDLGLAPALESLAHAMTQRGLPCEAARVGTAQSCRPEVEVTIYRIAQEALSNALDHADASHAWVTLTYAGEQLLLAVRDDGHGFDPEDVEHERRRRASSGQTGHTSGHTGLGLLGMRERAALLGAELEINSLSGQGTEVTLRVPLGATIGGLPQPASATPPQGVPQERPTRSAQASIAP